jgi:hypothetical protein
MSKVSSEILQTVVKRNIFGRKNSTVKDVEDNAMHKKVITFLYNWNIRGNE